MLTPQPVPGLDGTDGSLNVVANPAALPKVANAPKAPKATAPLVPQLGPIEPSARAARSVGPLRRSRRSSTGPLPQHRGPRRWGR